MQAIRLIHLRQNTQTLFLLIQWLSNDSPFPTDRAFAAHALRQFRVCLFETMVAEISRQIATPHADLSVLAEVSADLALLASHTVQ
jgi:hypothetical protein